ncbi:hypothetical protein [Anabaena azotica]|jgi:hypothetical protein|uniref:hypothetical protein n=1 Tax=Anabaena azotica TaxID=197653 RepID=UPI0039A74C83
MASQNTKIKFPLWHYLNQPLFNANTKLIWNPQRFALLWRIQLLERCLVKHCDAKGHHQS